MEWNQEADAMDKREHLIESVIELVGHEPAGLRMLLRTLSHPTIAHEVSTYFQSVDVEGKCLKYEWPWSCAREAEARYENIRYGWSGGTNGVGFDESWCEPCRKKVLGGTG